MDSQENVKGIPEEELEKVAGGEGVGGAVGDTGATCPNCGSTNTTSWSEDYHGAKQYHWWCHDCDCHWLDVEPY